MASASNPAVTAQNGAVTAPRAYEKYVRALSGEAEMTAGEFDGRDVSVSVTEKMMAADSLEAAFEVQDAGLLSGQDLVGIDQEVQSFEVVKSTKGEGGGNGFYFRVSSVALEDNKKLGLTVGEVFVYAVGATNVTNLLYRARADSRLPLKVRIESKAVSGGDLLLLRLIKR